MGVDYLLTLREEDDEELKPSATLWNLEAHLCYCVSVFFSSVVPHGASQQPAGQRGSEIRQKSVSCSKQAEKSLRKSL